MASLHMPHPSLRVSAIAETVREVFWVIALGVIGCYAFFVALGAFAPGDVVGLSIAVGVLVVLWLVHAWARGRARDDDRDPRLTAARERRGF
jgi:membrane protein implicated in regulation of membrane protease activity